MALDLGELVGKIGLDITPLELKLQQAKGAVSGFGSEGAAEAKQAGDKVGAAAAQGMDKIPVAAGAAGKQAAAELGQGLAGAASEADAAGSEAGSRFSDGFKSNAKAAGAAAGAGLGVAIGVGVADNLSVEAGLNKVAVQLGLSQADMKVAGQVAGQVYANNFGTDLPQINEAVAAVVKNIGIEVGSVSLQPITEQVLNLATAFDQDLGLTTSAIGQMIKTGMVKDAQEGLDALTAGLQSPANKADDLAEVMNEYGGQFQKLGLDGATAMGLLSQGVQGGAKDADIAADAFKEFSIRSIDGSKLTAGAFTQLGLDAGKMSADIAAGGPTARAGLDAVLDGLKNIKDPAERAQIAVSLFGTQSEDLGGALATFNVDTAVDGLGQVEGASQKAVDQMGSGAQATIDGYQRKLIDMGRSAIESTGPTAALAAGVAAFGPAVLGIAGPVASLILARSVQTTAAGTAAVAETAASGATVAGWLAASAASTLGAVKMAAAWLIAIGPIAIVIAAVAGVVFLVVKYWDEIKAFTGAAWDWVVEKVKAIPGLLIGFFTNFPLPGMISKHWNDIKGTIVDKGGAIIDWVGALPGKLVDKLSSLGNKLATVGREGFQSFRDAAGDKWDQIAGWVGSIPGKIVNNVGNVAGLLYAKGADVFQGLRNGAEDKWDAMAGWVSGIPGRILNKIGNVKDTLFSVGTDLVQGIWEGMKSLGDWLYNVVWNWIKSVIPAPIQKALGIASPSKVMRDLLKWVPVGMADGLDAGQPILDSAVSRLASTVTDMSIPAPQLDDPYFGSGPRPPGGGGGAMAASGGIGGGKIAENITIVEAKDYTRTTAEISRRQSFAGVGA